MKNNNYTCVTQTSASQYRLLDELEGSVEVSLDFSDFDWISVLDRCIGILFLCRELKEFDIFSCATKLQPAEGWGSWATSSSSFKEIESSGSSLSFTFCKEDNGLCNNSFFISSRKDWSWSWCWCFRPFFFFLRWHFPLKLVQKLYYVLNYQGHFLSYYTEIFKSRRSWKIAGLRCFETFFFLN